MLTPNCNEVKVYVAKSPIDAAKNTATFLLILSLHNFQIKYDMIGPNIAIENAFAPKVVIPHELIITLGIITLLFLIQLLR